MKSIAYPAKGFMLPMAIFLLVVLAALVGYAMRLAMLANLGTIQDVQGVQGYLAARAGVEWVAFQVLTPPSMQGMQGCPAAPAPFTVNGFNVVLNCNQSVQQDKGGTQNIGIYTIVSTASIGVIGAQDYTQRRMTVTLSRCIDAISGEECN